MSENELPKGFTCECGRYHEFDMYYFAHFDEVMIYTCPDCEQKYNLLRGKAVKTQ